MRDAELSLLVASIALCLHGCAHLPTLGFGVRSSWRSSERPLGRRVELLTGMTIGWAGARREARPSALVEPLQPRDEAAAVAIERAELPCADALFCRWEDDQRQAAFAREGLFELEGVAR